MALQDFLQPKQLDKLALLNMQDEFELHLNGGGKSSIASALHQFFTQSPITARKTYYQSYWQWYVRSAWESITQFSEDEMVQMLELTLPTAILLDVNLEEQFLYYMHRAVQYGKEQPVVYRHVQAVLQQSKTPLNVFEAQSMLLADVYKQAATLRGRDETDLQMAEYYAKVEDQLFSNESMYPDFTPTEKLPTVRWLVEFVFFFSREHDISQIVWDHFNDMYDVIDSDSGMDQTLERLEQEAANVAEENKAETTEAEKPKTVPPAPEPKAPVVEPIAPAPTAPSVPPAPVAAPVPPPPQPAAPSSGGYAQIKELIDARFQVDSTGQYENVAGVLALLDSLATEHSNPQIRALYFFDQKTGMFRWNDSLVQ